MPEITRRDFIAAFNTVVAVAVAPALLARMDAEVARPIGTEIYVGTWVAEPTIGSHKIDWQYWEKINGTGMRRYEEAHGVRLGEYSHDRAWHPDREAWFVLTLATVVGHA